MIRTEDDLRSMYRTGESTQATEDEIVRWIEHELSGAPAQRRGARRRWVAPVGAAVAVAAASVTVLAVVDRGDDPARPGIAAGPGSASASASAPLSSTGASPSTKPGIARVPLTAQVAQQTLLDLLPRTGTVTHRSGAAAPGQVLTELTFDDGHGAAGIDLAITYPVNGTSNTDWICDEANHGGTCSTLPGGSRLYSMQGYEYPDRRVDTLDWTASILRPDGMQIQISEWNAPTEKGTPISRPFPPFTITELTTVLTSPAWKPSVSAATAKKDADLFTPDDRLTRLADPPTGGPHGTPTR